MSLPLRPNDTKEIIAENIANYEQNSARLSRSERIRRRNEIIMLQLSTGTPKDEIQNQFKLSRRRLDEIIQEAEANAENWYKNLPKKYMIELFRINTNEIQKEIKHLTDLRQRSNTDIEMDRNLTNDIISARSAIIKTIADGPALIRTKELTDQLERKLEQK